MDSLLMSFLASLKAETEFLQHLEQLNLKLRESLIERQHSQVTQYNRELKEGSIQLEFLDQERERLWQELKQSYSLKGASFYAQINSLNSQNEEIKKALVQAYQDLKLAYQKLKNSTVSLEIYTHTALDITQTLLESMRLLEDDKYSSKGNRQTKESSETKAFLINEEL